MKIVVVCLAACAMVGSLHAQTAPQAAKSPLSAIDWVVGEWHATAAPPNGKPTQIDSRNFWSENRTAIFFSTRFNGQPHYSGMYAYDTARRTIAFWYVDTDGTFTQGTAHLDGRRLVQEFVLTKMDGSQQKLRSYLDPAADGSSYHWQVLGADEHKPLIELDYARTK